MGLSRVLQGLDCRGYIKFKGFRVLGVIQGLESRGLFRV